MKKNFFRASDDVLEILRREEPEFPMWTAECVIWNIEHHTCENCKHFKVCRAFVLGLEIGRYVYSNRFSGGAV